MSRFEEALRNEVDEIKQVSAEVDAKVLFGPPHAPKPSPSWCGLAVVLADLNRAELEALEAQGEPLLWRWMREADKRG